MHPRLRTPQVLNTSPPTPRQRQTFTSFTALHYSGTLAQVEATVPGHGAQVTCYACACEIGAYVCAMFDAVFVFVRVCVFVKYCAHALNVGHDAYCVACTHAMHINIV
jgi:hypothetical protein